MIYVGPALALGWRTFFKGTTDPFVANSSQSAHSMQPRNFKALRASRKYAWVCSKGVDWPA